jgi:NTE family protein
MSVQVQRHFTGAKRHLPFEVVALVLQGGGALGAYQAGVYEALAEAGIHPDWTAGVSIGAINAAIIAGNPPYLRVDRLRQFWTLVTKDQLWSCVGDPNEAMRHLLSQMSSGFAVLSGARGFFAARPISPLLQPHGTVEATSFYDTSNLKNTPERLVDFDRLNAGVTRLSVGTVNVRTGNLVYFDTTTHTLGSERIMASGAIPPSLPAVEIEGEHYWDGGLVSNKPLQLVVDTEPRRDTLAFQVDLWGARGEIPRNIFDVMTREKEIFYSSRTRDSTDQFKYVQRLRNTLAGLLEKLPHDLKNSAEARLLGTVAERKIYNIVQLIYRAKNYEGHSKDHEFSRLSMNDHWRSGYHDARPRRATARCLNVPQITKASLRSILPATDGSDRCEDVELRLNLRKVS